MGYRVEVTLDPNQINDLLKADKASKSLNLDQINDLLKADKAKKQRGPRKDITEPREIAVWFKLPHKVADFADAQGNEITPHCENPDCKDPRPHDDRGRNVIAFIKGKMCCRYCFLAGWLSESDH